MLHYAIELFEGMKAYRGIDNKIRLFRPDANMARMNATAARAALPVSFLHLGTIQSECVDLFLLYATYTQRL